MLADKEKGFLLFVEEVIVVYNICNIILLKYIM